MITKHHPYGWEVKVQVILAGGARHLVMGVSTRGGGTLFEDQWNPWGAEPSEKHGFWLASGKGGG